MKTKSTYTLTTQSVTDMNTMDLRFRYGANTRIFSYPYNTTEAEAEGLIQWKLPQIAEEWNVAPEKIDIEIVYVKRIK